MCWASSQIRHRSHTGWSPLHCWNLERVSQDVVGDVWELKLGLGRYLCFPDSTLVACLRRVNARTFLGSVKDGGGGTE
jgi:hypothetical protein